MLRSSEIECRIATISDKGLSLLLYKDARVDDNILDETVGAERWQRSHELINGNLFCNVGIKFGDEWVWKQDVGTESYTEKEKGQASDSFKRACFQWGIGRELYTAPFIWITPDLYTAKERNGKLTTYDKFSVSEIDYTDGAITYLKIINAKSGKTVYTYGSTSHKAQIDDKKQQVEYTPTTEKPLEMANTASQTAITPKQALTLRMMCRRHKMPEGKIYSIYGRSSMDEMTINDWIAFGKIGQELLNSWDKEHADEAHRQA
jgi:hypothetical protein